MSTETSESEQKPLDLESLRDNLTIDEGVNLQDLDILTEDLSGVDTSMPLIRDELYEVKLASLKVGKTKAGKGSLNLRFDTLNETKDIEGKHVNSGYPLFHQVTLTPSEKYTKDQIKKAVAQIAQALKVKTLTEQCVGLKCLVKTRVRKEREDETTGEVYPARVEIKSFKAAL